MQSICVFVGVCVCVCVFNWLPHREIESLMDHFVERQREERGGGMGGQGEATEAEGQSVRLGNWKHLQWSDCWSSPGCLMCSVTHNKDMSWATNGVPADCEGDDTSALFHGRKIVAGLCCCCSFS